MWSSPRTAVRRAAAAFAAFVGRRPRSTAAAITVAAAVVQSSDGVSRTLKRSQVQDFPHQAGGHGGIVRVPQSGSVMKPVMPGKKGQVERDFYIDAQGDKWLQIVIPEFQGFVCVEDEEYIQLADVTEGFRLPCIIDLKMGRVTFDPLATAYKRDREASKYPWQSELGFRITGMKIYDHSLRAYRHYDKHFGRRLTPDQIPSAFRELFDTGMDAPLHPQLLPALDRRLAEIYDFFDKHNTRRFFASSLLVVFEADPSAVVDDAVVAKPPRGKKAARKADRTVGAPPVGLTRKQAVAAAAVTPQYRTGSRVAVYMIDFGHVFPIEETGGKDDSYMYGIRSLRRLLPQAEAAPPLPAALLQPHRKEVAEKRPAKDGKRRNEVDK